MNKNNEQKDKFEVEVVDDLKTIENVIREFDTVFTPSISSKIPDLEGYAKKIKDNGILFLIKENLYYIGLAILYANDFKGRVAYLPQIAVKPVAQHSGIGTLLLEECINEAKRLGVATLKLEVVATNDKAINFYIKHGFKYHDKASSSTQYMVKEL